MVRQTTSKKKKKKKKKNRKQLIAKVTVNYFNVYPK
jgi:hypothetical protein